MTGNYTYIRGLSRASFSAKVYFFKFSPLWLYKLVKYTGFHLWQKSALIVNISNISCQKYYVTGQFVFLLYCCSIFSLFMSVLRPMHQLFLSGCEVCVSNCQMVIHLM